MVFSKDISIGRDHINNKDVLKKLSNWQEFNSKIKQILGDFFYSGFVNILHLAIAILNL